MDKHGGITTYDAPTTSFEEKLLDNQWLEGKVKELKEDKEVLEQMIDEQERKVKKLQERQ